MPIFLLQVLNPSIGVIQKLEQLFARFFWGSTAAQRKIHWTKWQNICYPVEEGGLGVRNLRDVVEAFSQKLWWRLRLNNSLWAKFTISKYCGAYFPGLAKFTKNDSPVWRRLCNVRQETQQQIFWSLGDGEASFWHDNWLPEGILQDLANSQITSHEPVKLYWRNGNWNTACLQQILPAHLVDLVSSIPILKNQKDHMHWKLSKNGDFTTASAWELIRNHQTAPAIFKRIWSPFITPTTSVFLWRQIHGWIPVDVRLKRKGINMASRCCCCSEEEATEETEEHLFLLNNQARQAWQFFADRFSISLPETHNTLLFIQAWRIRDTQQLHIRDIIPMIILWNIWTLRNDVKYREAKFKANIIIFKTVNQLQIISESKLWRPTHIKGDSFGAALLRIFPQHKLRGQKPIIVRWEKPPEGWKKLNTDGASRGNPGVSGAGGVIRDHLGKVLFAFQEPLGISSNTYAELQAVYRGLQICLEKSFDKVWIETDATSVIQLISQPLKGSWQHQILLQLIRNIMEQLDTKITHIYREGNQVADYFANQACSSQQLTILKKEEVTGNARGLIRLDTLSIPCIRLVKE